MMPVLARARFLRVAEDVASMGQDTLREAAEREFGTRPIERLKERVNA